ncbi:alpha/beta fold hydrolase [Roseobacter sp. HKCCA0434]|uniref:alpha/beta fold hydrolase n=1 Tax=Roseobacter sp. HKCCA0434 TaxID=3079297 RepID=UPI002905D1E9|nr:alpha/beta fold hydrolase [Roseobacter sp. HKCCA0434]
MTSRPASLLTLIDRAYAVGEGHDVPHSVFCHATDILDAAPDEERPETAAELALHADRIARLFGMTGASPDGVVAATGGALRTSGVPSVTLDAATGRLTGGNHAFAALCDAPPTHLHDLPFESFGLDNLLATIRAGRPADLHLLTDTRDGRPVLVLADPMSAGTVLRFTALRWTDEMIARIARPFALSPREVEVLRGALAGERLSEIAARLGRSVETIRSQSKSLLARTGMARMADLVLLASSAACLSAERTVAPPQPPRESLESLVRADGRRVTWRCFGPAGGTPFLFFHGLQLGPFLTPALERGLARENIRLIAPSRPGFGETAPSATDREFDRTVVEDALAVLESERIERFIVLGHQGGGSHAFRTVAALGDRVPGLLMISAGVPIDMTRHVPKMNAITRMAALAAKRTPALLDLLIRVGVHAYTRDADGPRRYLEYYFRNDPVDRASLDDPQVFAALRAGALHMIAQGPRTILRDGASAMADWTADFQAVTCRQLWLHGAHCPVMDARELEHYIRTHTNHPIEIAPDCGVHLLYDVPERALDVMRRAAAWLD